MVASILLLGGTVLTHDEHDHVHAAKADLLIEGNLIKKIESGISPFPGTQVVDCTDKIISPGFIDTHHHVWQTLLKGRHANHTLLEYFGPGNFAASVHSPTDIFWGQLGGALECLDVGTTTVVDHASVNISAEHSKAAIAATVSSGIRSIFGYCPIVPVENWKPFTLGQNLLAEWVLKTLEELGSKSPFGNGRVHLGFAFDGTYLPKEVLVNLFSKAKAAGVKIITTHYVRAAVPSQLKAIETLHSHGLLDSSILFSHGSNMDPDEAALLLNTNSHVSVTPSTELQMGHGEPVAFQSKLGIQSHCSLGIDCHSNNTASIPGEMRLLLQSARGTYNQPFLAQSKVPAKVYKTVEEAFNLGTIYGARAIGMDDRIGSLAVGKLADLVVFDASSPSMVCGAQHDAVAAVVLHSSPGDIEMVVVDGMVRKQEKRLSAVDVAAGRGLWAGEERDILEWADVARMLVERREALQETLGKINYDEAKAGVIRAFHVDGRNIVDSL
ncbi:5-methylthioadenosine/S-adenosylhomocysteine deaminase [Lachnellula subtilissima]|uniref:5-methylthioadenosine/S-adenosylhomocysteine deaminase n=1 Tax=Lachnellula subtilissima TaxID=602034 RepID=A0A8H8RCZ7_9HELO|nr:5-methylthioadenosine/S-adenosylhomocysteine deaminase [Lachnellula subtilissima]